jgi:IS4 transposase
MEAVCRARRGSAVAREKHSQTEVREGSVRRGACDRKEKMLVRVVEYQVEFEDGTRSETVRLITTLLDPDGASSDELAHLYSERWNVETGFDELKTHLKGSGRVLRSQLPEIVVQEFYGFLLAYFVVRKVMADAARMGGVSPAELSFVHSVRVIKRRLTENIPPCGEEKSLEVVV